MLPKHWPPKCGSPWGPQGDNCVDLFIKLIEQLQIVSSTKVHKRGCQTRVNSQSPAHRTINTHKRTTNRFQKSFNAFDAHDWSYAYYCAITRFPLKRPRFHHRIYQLNGGMERFRNTCVYCGFICQTSGS